MVSICLKARCKYKKQALFLSCFGVYTVSATFCLVFSGYFAGFWVLFLGFLQFQLLFLGFSPAFGLGLGAVLRISAVSATFSRNFSGFWAGFLSCFGNFCSFSYFFSQLFQLLVWFWKLFWGFLQFQLLFSQFFRLLS